MRGVEVNVYFLFDWTYGKGEKGRWGRNVMKDFSIYRSRWV
jgi:hypothetical protein